MSFAWTLICGDAHVGLLTRCLTSLLRRQAGPSCTTLVIGWNGTQDAALLLALSSVFNWDAPFADVEFDQETKSFPGLRLCIFRGSSPMKVGFAGARMETQERARSEWIGYVDADDTLLSPEDSLVQESIDSSFANEPAPRTPSFVGNLVDRLAALPPHINCITAPYFYVLSAERRPLLKNRRPRIIRQDGYWAWTKDVHEVWVHVLGREVRLHDPGLVFAHEPVLSMEERTQRNFALIDSSPSGKLPTATADFHSGVAAQAAEIGDYVKAAEHYGEAAKLGNTDEAIHYVSMASHAWMTAGLYAAAASAALQVVDLAPQRPDGYLLASAVAAARGNTLQAIQWYEAGGKNPIPADALVDDRVFRIMGPVRGVGVAYLRHRLYKKALEVAETALKLTEDPFTRRLFKEAERHLWSEQVSERATALIGGLLTRPATTPIAVAIAKAVEPLLEDSKLLPEGVDIRPTESWGADSTVAQWMGGQVDAVRLLEPLDALGADGISATLELPELDGQMVVGAARDPRDGGVLTADRLVETVSANAVIEEMQLIDGALAVRAKASRAAPWRPDVTFFCPVRAEPWGPWRIIRSGTGGSEEAVIYLATELSRRGMNVQVYAPLDPNHRGVHIDQRVRWYPLEKFDELKEIPGFSISCRVPSAVKLPAFDLKRLFVWHQDASYSTGWNPHVAEAVGNLWVSRWQRQVLLGSINCASKSPEGDVDGWGRVIGDGIPQSALDVPWPKTREHRVAYISSPLRGLTHLLDVWPKVLEEVPDAQLDVYYGWYTAPLSNPAVSRFREEVTKKLHSTPRVEWADRVPQRELEALLPNYSVWVHAGFNFEEGYCIAGMRAAAAGCIPVYVKTGAMSEVQHPSPWTVDLEEGLEGLTHKLVQALKFTDDPECPQMRETLAHHAAKHTWGSVADRLLATFAERA